MPQLLVPRPGLDLSPFVRRLPVASVPRRTFLVAAAAAALAGCGSGSSGEPAAAPDQTIEVETRFGRVMLPRAPQRVVSAYDTSTDFAYALGLPLVGLGGSGPASRDLAEYQRGLGLDALPKLSTFPEPDVEAILRLEPDLVLDDFALDEKGAKKLSPVVPVFAFGVEPETTDWRDLLREMAGIFQAEDKAETFISSYDERAADLRSRLQSRWAGATFAYVGPYGDGTYYIAQATMTTNRVLHGDLGFAFASAVPPDVETRQVDVSMEKLSELDDADLLLLRTNPKADGTGVDEKQIQGFQESSLWRKLPAVRQGHDFLIPGALFYTSPMTAAANLDWAEANLLG